MPHKTPCLIGSASIASFARGSTNNSLFCTSDLSLKMTSNQKTFNMKVVRLVKTVKIAFGLVSIEDRLPPQKLPARSSQLKQTVLESSDKINPNLTRVLDVNPSLFLAREVQPPLIYL